MQAGLPVFRVQDLTVLVLVSSECLVQAGIDKRGWLVVDYVFPRDIMSCVLHQFVT